MTPKYLRYKKFSAMVFSIYGLKDSEIRGVFRAMADKVIQEKRREKGSFGDSQVAKTERWDAE